MPSLHPPTHAIRLGKVPDRRGSARTGTGTARQGVHHQTGYRREAGLGWSGSSSCSLIPPAPHTIPHRNHPRQRPPTSISHPRSRRVHSIATSGEHVPLARPLRTPQSVWPAPPCPSRAISTTRGACVCFLCPRCRDGCGATSARLASTCLARSFRWGGGCFLMRSSSLVSDHAHRQMPTTPRASRRGWPRPSPCPFPTGSPGCWRHSA